MVFFTCDGCNESLKKNQVDKHAFRCRHCQSVTCIDCGISFYGNDYTTHLTCISEAEKYEKTLYKAKEKLSSQDIWMNSLIASVQNSSNAPITIRPYLEKLLDFGNIPRNKNKFINFLKNSLKLSSIVVIDQLWEWISRKDTQGGDGNNDSYQQQSKSQIQPKLQQNRTNVIKIVEIANQDNDKGPEIEKIALDEDENQIEKKNEKKKKKKKDKTEMIEQIIDEEIDSGKKRSVDRLMEDHIKNEEVEHEKKKHKKKKHKKFIDTD